MRRIVLWAGQKILFGLWLLGWPFIVWRWERRKLSLPPQERTKIRRDCAVGIISCGFIGIGTFQFFDFSLLEIVLVYYLAPGMIVINRARGLDARYR